MTDEEDLDRLKTAARSKRIAVFLSGRDRFAGWPHIHLIEKSSGRDCTLGSFYDCAEALRWLCPQEVP